MPRVPSITEQQVRQRPISPGYQTTGADGDAFGVEIARAQQQLGGAIQNASNTATQVLTRLQQEKNDASIMEADLEYTNKSRLLLHGDGSQQRQGYYSRQGKDALDTGADTAEELRKIKREIMARYDNHAVQKKLGLMLGTREERHSQQMATFQSDQRGIYLDTLTEARLNEAVQDAVADPSRMALSHAIMEDAVHAMADRRGYDPEVRQSKLEEARTTLYSGVIRAAIQRRDASATKALMDTYGEQMDAPVRAQLREQANALFLAAESQVEMDKYLAVMEQDGLSENAILKLIRSDLSNHPDLRDEVERRFNNEVARITREDARALKDARQGAFTELYQGKSVDDVLASNPSRAAILMQDGTAMDALHRAERNVAEGELYANASDGKTYATLKGMGTREQAEIVPEEHRANLTLSEYNKLITDVASARRRLETGTDTAARVLNNAEADLARDLKGNKTYFKKNKATEAFNGVITDLRNWVYERVDETGKAPTDREIKTKAAELSTLFEYDPVGPNFLRGGFGPTRAADLTTEQYNTLPEEQRQQVVVPINRVPADMVEAIRHDFPGADNRTIEEAATAITFGDRERYERLMQTNAPAPTPGPVSEDTGSLVNRIVMAESSGNANARNPLSSATGAGQFIETTWLQLFRKHYPDRSRNMVRREILALRSDPNLSRQMVELYAQENAERLTADGLPVNDSTLYLSHVFGSSGASKLLKAGPEMNAAQILGGRVIESNPHLRGMTVGQVIEWAEGKV